MQEGYLSTHQNDNTFQRQIYCLNFRMFYLILVFCDLECKKEMEDKMLKLFFGSAKRINKIHLVAITPHILVSLKAFVSPR